METLNPLAALWKHPFFLLKLGQIDGMTDLQWLESFMPINRCLTLSSVLSREEWRAVTDSLLEGWLISGIRVFLYQPVNWLPMSPLFHNAILNHTPNQICWTPFIFSINPPSPSFWSYLCIPSLSLERKIFHGQAPFLVYSTVINWCRRLKG